MRDTVLTLTPGPSPAERSVLGDQNFFHLKQVGNEKLVWLKGIHLKRRGVR